MKDHASLLAGMAELPDLRALLIGAGTESLPAAANVLRLGRRRDVARVLAAADVAVSSSRFGEGFSNALAEGMACGLPAVATDVGDAKLIIGDTGLVVPPGDRYALASALRTLAREPAAVHAERSARARARIVENFSLSRAIERFGELYGSLLAGMAR
jgi:glycosyltransferase involved in cell wall biosynthesis